MVPGAGKRTRDTPTATVSKVVFHKDTKLTTIIYVQTA